MIIRCDQCKTRFRLDDSKVTASGVRVRCSKCKHTFVVRKEAHEEELDVEGTSCNPESMTDYSSKQADHTVGDVTESTVFERNCNEMKFPCESDSAPAQGLTCVTGDEGTCTVEEDFHLFRTGKSDPGTLSADEDPEKGEKPFQWQFEEETNEKQEQEEDDFEITTKEEKEEKNVISWGMEDFPKNNEEENSLVDDTPSVDAVEGQTIESNNHICLSEADRGQSWANFPADRGLMGKEDDSEESVDFSLGYEIDRKSDDQIPAEKDQPFIVSNLADSGVVDDTTDLFDLPAENEHKRESFNFTPGLDRGFSTPYPADETEETLPPLPITSRRKGALSLTKALAGIFLIVLITVITGFFFFREDFAALNIPGISAFNNLFTTGHWKNEDIVIKNLEGTFVRNNHGGDVFVIRGEVSNQSGKPSSSIRVQGHIYGKKGDVLLSRYAYFGKVLSNDQLVGLPVNEIAALAGNQSGSIPRDLTMQTGTITPFQIVFLDVPRGAGEFGAEVVASGTKSQ